MTDETKRWFVEKAAQNPEWVLRKYLPEMEKELSRAEVRLHKANREEGIEQIKYRMGWFDGVETCLKMIEGMRSSEKPVDPGLMDRIFGRNLSPAENG